MDGGSVTLQEVLKNPTQVIDALFQQDPSSLDYASQQAWSPGPKLEQALNGHWDQIPLLDQHSVIPHGSLVRYRGMVQDMHDPEFYLGAYEEVDTQTGKRTKRTGKYRDVVGSAGFSIDPSSPSSVTLDRQLLFCIPIPGLSSWAEQVNQPLPIAASGGSDSKGKRKLPEENGDGMQVDDVDSKKQRDRQPDQFAPDQKGDISSTLDSVVYPLPDRQRGVLSLVKIYDQAELKLNEVFEFIGILSNAPQPVNREESEMESDMVSSLPSSLVPQIHCLFHRKLGNLELVNSSLKNQPGLVLDQQSIAAIRNDLLMWIGSAFGGDMVVAEYILLFLLSRVYRRHDRITLGNLSLNVCGCPENNSGFRQRVEHLMASILPKYHYFPLTIHNICQTKFTPRKDYTSNKLHSGALQLSDGTFFIIDQTKLEAGKIDEKGMANIQTLSNLISHQKVEYDFQFHPLEFQSDIPVIILSPTSAILNCDLKINLLPTTQEVPTPLLSDETLHRFRVYLAALRQYEYSVSDELSKVLQDHFVETRKANSAYTQEAFHLQLTLARLCSLSFGEKSLPEHIWKHMLSLEDQRLQRSTVK